MRLSVRNWVILLFSVCISIALSWLVSVYVEGRYYGAMPSLIVAKKENVSIKVRSDAIIYWRYKELFSPVSGKVFYLRKYDRVRKGEKVGVISTPLGKRVYVRATYAGLFLPFYDRWNRWVNPSARVSEIAVSLQKIWDNRIKEGIVHIKEGMWVKKGGTIGMLVYGYGFYLYFSLPKCFFNPRWRGSRYVRVDFLDFGGYSNRGFIDYLSLHQDRVSMLLWFFIFDEKRNFKRHWTHVDVVVKRKKGVVLPASAVIIKKGIRGIMIANKGIAQFYPVEGEWINTKKFLATNVKEKLLIVSNPTSVREGMWIGY